MWYVTKLDMAGYFPTGDDFPRKANNIVACVLVGGIGVVSRTG